MDEETLAGIEARAREYDDLYPPAEWIMTAVPITLALCAALRGAWAALYPHCGTRFDGATLHDTAVICTHCRKPWEAGDERRYCADGHAEARKYGV